MNIFSLVDIVIDSMELQLVDDGDSMKWPITFTISPEAFASWYQQK